MRSLLLCLLVVAGVQSMDITVLDITDFPSKFLGNMNHTAGLLDVMRGHFNTSLDFLFESKVYDSQYVQRPGMAKLLSKESDRHWEEGMSVLKKYLHLGGTTYDSSFQNSMSFGKGSDVFDQTGTAHDKYKGSFKTLMTVSRRLGNAISDLCHVANHRTAAHGDVAVAHYLEEKAEKESEVARNMVGHYMTLQKMESFGIAFDIYDKSL